MGKIKITQHLETKYSITIFGAGYVGFSLAALLGMHHKVFVIDTDISKIQTVNNNMSPVSDKDIENLLSSKKLDISAFSNISEIETESDYYVIATPTDFDESTLTFDTNSVDSIVEMLIKNKIKKPIIIKSTIPIGHTEKLTRMHKVNNIFFSPEFLREGSALNDNLYPSRIVAGRDHPELRKFVKLLENCVLNTPKILFMSASEAEATKLFANAYLAMRVSFFNELDNYSMVNNLDSRVIIDSLSEDSRIGSTYNNPSFGYGGYCLPKDTKQLLSEFSDVPQNLISAIIESNTTRKLFISKKIKELNPDTVGIYRLQMKSNSDNMRSSSIIDIIKVLQKDDFELIIFEPNLKTKKYNSIRIINNLEKFKSLSSLIVANRITDDLRDVSKKVFSRDIFFIN